MKIYNPLYGWREINETTTVDLTPDPTWGRHDKLSKFLKEEEEEYIRTTGASSLPPISDIALHITSDKNVARYISTRLHYYGGLGTEHEIPKDQLFSAARYWAKEALNKPRHLD